MFYRSLYEYFRDVVLKPEVHVLDGEQMKSSPTQREATDALKTLWTKLGGTVVSILVMASLFADVLPTTQWQDVPPTNTLSEALNAWPNPVPKRTKFGSYLWEIGTAGEDFTKATNRLACAYPSYGGCSGLTTHRYHGRTLDWYYNKQVSTLVRKPETVETLGFIGVGDGVLNEELVASGAWTNAYWSVPFSLSDGMNTRGVVIQQNVLYKKPYSEWPVGSVDWKTKRPGCIIVFAMLRYALERATNALAAAELIRDKNFMPAEFAYDNHYLISDRTSSYIVEDGKIYSSADNIPVDAITNFRIAGVIYDPADNRVDDWNTVEPYGMGVERYNLLRDDTPVDLTGMVELMKTVWYTKAYTELGRRWLTEFCTPDHNPPLTVQLAKSSPAEFNDVFQQERENYSKDHEDPAHYRTGLSWQTVHMSVYDKETLTLHLYTQEDETTEKIFKIGGPATWAMAGEPMPTADLSSRTTFEQSTNIVTGIMSKIRINGQQLSEDVSITTFAPFKSTWTTGSGINQFFASVARDSDAKDGTAFLGQLSGSSTPWGSGNCEATLQVMKNTHGSLIYVVSVYSTDISPYYWFNMSVSGGSGNGWRSFDPAGTTVSKTALQGQTFDFSTMNGVYSGLKAVIEKMGGTVVNAPTND